MTKLLTTCLLASSLFLSVQVVNAEHHKMKSDAERVEFKIEKMAKHLDLTEEQKQQIKPILAEKMATMKKVREDARLKIQAFLTDEQKAKMEEHKGKKFKQCRDKK